MPGPFSRLTDGIDLLERQLQAQLRFARGARPQHGVGESGAVRRGAGAAESAAGAGIRRSWRGKVGPVEQVEELDSERGGIPLLELPLLGNRQIHVVEGRPAEYVLRQVAHGSVSGRSEHVAVLHVASGVLESRERECLQLGIARIGSDCRSLADRRRRAAQERPCTRRLIAKARNLTARRMNRRERGWVALEIPRLETLSGAVQNLAGSPKVVGRIVDAPGRSRQTR